MKKKLSIPSFMVLIFAFVLMEGCKIEITVPEGGKVVSASHAYDCRSGETCVVEVNDFYFDEKFDAHASEGWIFVGWKLGRGYLCQRSESVCRLSNKGLEQYEAISAIVQSDEKFFLEPEFVKATPFDEALANVRDENLRACLNEVPPPKKYAEQLTYLVCFEYSLGYIEGIENFKGLRTLSIIGAGTIRNITPLAKLTRLEHISLDHNRIKDVSPLAGLKQLQSLELSRNPIRDISRLAELKQLRNLKIGGIATSDIAPLAGLAQLESLSANFNDIEDISPLAGLTNLKDISLHSNRVSDLSPLAGLKQLERLGLGYNFVTSIVPLAGLPEVLHLDFQWNRITTVIDTLDTLPSLQLLSIAGNPIPCTEIVALDQSRILLGLSRDQYNSCGIP